MLFGIKIDWAILEYPPSLTLCCGLHHGCENCLQLPPKLSVQNSSSDALKVLVLYLLSECGKFSHLYFPVYDLLLVFECMPLTVESNFCFDLLFCWVACERITQFALAFCFMPSLR